jgi:prepilin-type N-terminal cleavage/methylation domain-containing protein
MRKLQQAGDTIVEVLIVIAVISLVLAAAFVTSNRSVHSVRDAQEHGEAQTLVAGQIEELKALGSNNTMTPSILSMSTPFCVAKTGANLQLYAYSATPPTPCIVTGGGRQAGATVQPAYSLQINRSYNNATKAYTFTVQATWASVTGRGTNNVTMYYRLYAGS